MSDVSVTNAHGRLRIPTGETERLVRTVLRSESAPQKRISVVFVGSRFIRNINKQFLGHDAVTDVISFPLDGEGGPDGEIYVNLDRAKRQARDYGVRYTDEVRRLVVHGVLHLVGYHDATERQQQRMQRREDQYLRAFRSKRA